MECVKTENKQMILFKAIRLLKYIYLRQLPGKNRCTFIYILTVRSIYRNHLIEYPSKNKKKVFKNER